MLHAIEPFLSFLSHDIAKNQDMVPEPRMVPERRKVLSAQGYIQEISCSFSLVLDRSVKKERLSFDYGASGATL